MYEIIDIHHKIEICYKVFTVVIKFDDCKDYTIINVNACNLNYNYLVNKLINLRYPNDVMQSIINNYLLDNEDVEILNDFKKMQDWRKVSKQIAKDILNQIS